MPEADRFSLSLSFLADKRKVMSSASWCYYDVKLRKDRKSQQSKICKVVTATLQMVTLQVRVGNAENECHSTEGMQLREKMGELKQCEPLYIQYPPFR